MVQLPQRRRTCSCSVPPIDNGRRKITAQGNDDESFIFEANYDDVPASMVIMSDATTNREAIGAAYLVAERFCEWAMEQLKAKPKSVAPRRRKHR